MPGLGTNRKQYCEDTEQGGATCEGSTAGLDCKVDAGPTSWERSRETLKSHHRGHCAQALLGVLPSGSRSLPWVQVTQVLWQWDLCFSLMSRFLQLVSLGHSLSQREKQLLAKECVVLTF